MIPRVHPRGARVAGLLHYLYGPGKHEEHRNPRLVAAWQGAGPLAGLQPSRRDDGKYDLRRLVTMLEDPIHFGNRPPAKPVWHCSLRLAPQDRTLSDELWGHLAAEFMAHTGLAAHHDDEAVRWVAVRHGDDHIHLVATLVRQDGRTEPAFQDFIRCRAAARSLEERFGLMRTAPADRTAPRRAGPREVRKAARQGHQEPARDRLRREVRFAAAAAGSETEFFDLLHEAGLVVRLRHSSVDPAQVTGYAVALSETAPTGRPVFFGGGRLAADLTLPKLRARWDSGSPSATRRFGWRVNDRTKLLIEAARHVQSAAQEIRHLTRGDPAADANSYAASDVLTATARLLEGDRPGALHRAADALDRAARQPFGRQPPSTSSVRELRTLSRALALASRNGDDIPIAAARRLLVSMSQLADSVADLRRAQNQLHQARAARTASRLLREAAAAQPTHTEGPLQSSPAEDLTRSTMSSSSDMPLRLPQSHHRLARPDTGAAEDSDRPRVATRQVAMTKDTSSLSGSPAPRQP